MKRKLETRDISMAAMFLAAMIIGAHIRIPFPLVPITLQTLFVLFFSMVMGPWLSSFALLTYIFMGLLGMPIFTGGGGPAYILMPTFGYLLGFILAAWFVGKVFRKISDRGFVIIWLVNLVGLALIYISGFTYALLLWLSGIFDVKTLEYYLSLSFIITVFADIMKSLAAVFAAQKLSKILKKIKREPI